MKRMSQAVEVRRLVDWILDAEPDARIVVAVDFNAAPDEVPVRCIRHHSKHIDVRSDRHSLRAELPNELDSAVNRLRAPES